MEAAEVENALRHAAPELEDLYVDWEPLVGGYRARWRGGAALLLPGLTSFNAHAMAREAKTGGPALRSHLPAIWRIHRAATRRPDLRRLRVRQNKLVVFYMEVQHARSACQRDETHLRAPLARSFLGLELEMIP